MVDKIIKCNSFDEAKALTRKLYEEDCIRLGNPEILKTNTTDNLLGIDENILTGEFGLHLPSNYRDKVDKKHLNNLFIKSPFWINERFINGNPFFALGVGPFGFAQVNPQKNRENLEKDDYLKAIKKEVKQKTREYTLQVQSNAQKIITDYVASEAVRKKILETLDPFLFEELVAELLVDKGFDIFLTPRTGDGGKDIIASYTFNDVPILMLVECKRRQISKTLGPVEFRALTGQFYYEKTQNSRINYAMLVTTAGKIGPTSLEMSDRLNDMSITHFEKLNKWLLNYGKLKNGLWIPESFNEMIK